MAKSFDPSELVLAPDGSLYHIRLFPEQIADTVLLVGDPGRVKTISSYFSSIESTSDNREISSATGIYNGTRLTVLSTGMGTDNIDIVITELDAAVNIDLKKKELHTNHKALNLIRLGTCGALQPNINAGECILSEYAIGIDGLLYFYKGNEKVIDKDMTRHFVSHMQWPTELPNPYAIKSSEDLLQKINLPFHKGITVTAPGFYGPQGREIRLETAIENVNEKLAGFSFSNRQITNLEMETSALYGLSRMLGHNALTSCLVIANRSNGTFLSDYKPYMNRMIEQILNQLTVSI